MEHPQAIQLIATLLQEFDVQSLSHEKFEKIDRSKLEHIEHSNKKETTHRPRNHRRRRHRK